MKIKFRNLYPLFFLFLIIYIFLFSDVGYFSRKKLKENILQLQIKIEKLKNENNRLKKEIELLKSDPEYIAEMARKLGYARKGEKIYRFKMENTNINSSLTNKISSSPSSFDTSTIIGGILLFLSFLYLVILYYREKES